MKSRIFTLLSINCVTVLKLCSVSHIEFVSKSETVINLVVDTVANTDRFYDQSHHSERKGQNGSVVKVQAPDHNIVSSRPSTPKLALARQSLNPFYSRVLYHA